MAGATLYTLDALAEQAIRILTGSRPTADTHIERRELTRHMRAIAADLIRGRWFEVRKTGEMKQLGPIYLATFNGVEVKKEQATGKNYIDLPAIPEDLPDDTGLQNIQPETGKPEKDVPMIPLPSNADIVIQSLPAGALEQRFGFSWQRTKAYFTTKGDRTVLKEDIATVEVRMITVGPEEVDDYSPFPLPADMFPVLLSRTLSIFGLSIDPEKIDLKNDNN